MLILQVPSSSSLSKELYNPKTFFTHAASLDQGCPHCPIFPTAASRRSLDRFSVPVWLSVLSDQLLIIGLVGLYPTNYLIRREPIFLQINPLVFQTCDRNTLCGISTTFAMLFPRERQVTHALLTRPPLAQGSKLPVARST